MKKNIIKVILLILLAVIMLLFCGYLEDKNAMNVVAKECDVIRIGQNEEHGYIYNPYPDPIPIRCTCYVITGETASGKYTRPGIIAGRKEDLGKTAILYAMDDEGNIGDIIDIYEFLDTGSFHTLKEGTSVDVWQPSMEAANEWVKKYGDYVYIQRVNSNG